MPFSNNTRYHAPDAVESKGWICYNHAMKNRALVNPSDRSSYWGTAMYEAGQGNTPGDCGLPLWILAFGNSTIYAI